MAFEIKNNVLIKYIPENGRTDVIIPEGITGIAKYAFYECKNITSVTLPESVEYIREYAFAYCDSLKSINLPDSIKIIYNHAFEACKNLISIKIPDGIKNIYEYTFFYCEKLRDITIPESVEYIDKHAFSDTAWLEEKLKENPLVIVNNVLVRVSKNFTGMLEIPEGITSIAGFAFYECRQITDIIFPETLESIEEYAFNCCYAKINMTLPESVSYIGKEAFCFLHAEKLEIPKNVRRLREGLFSSARIHELIIPESISYIHSNALDNIFNIILKGEKTSVHFHYLSVFCNDILNFICAKQKGRVNIFRNAYYKSDKIIFAVFIAVEYNDPDGWKYIDTNITDVVDCLIKIDDMDNIINILNHITDDELDKLI